MQQGVKVCLLVISLIVIYSTGCLIFTRGFLLKRSVVNENSTCHADFSVQKDDHGDDGCWQHSRFKRAIIIVIDALKYEFMKYDPKLKSKSFFLNKLPFLNNVLNRKPKHSRLYRFIADPPTTTLQRIKGLTTGSLPTFVDAGANFASAEITEDNIIDQLITQDKKIKFLGDDTWMGLFPNRFSKAFPFPSFNVKDLHTVDNGILQHLMPEIRKRNWDIMIAHFLGVDHCGHRFGPNHPAMAEKLSQMDQMLSNVTREMKDDTVLFVLGDHGMTKTGDHGGDSDDELEAGLFVYSPSQLAATDYTPDVVNSVAQTDLVPTLALLLGVPIPFSNLGMVIKDLFTHCSWWKTSTSDIKQVYHSVKALRLNAHQINNYLKTYSTVSSDFPQDKWSRLQELLHHSETDLQSLLTSMVQEGETADILKRFRKLEDHYAQFMTDVREICQGIWAKFDVMSILIGILTMAVGLSINILILRCLTRDGSDSWTPVYVATTAGVVYLVYAIVQTIFLSDFVNPMMLFVLGGMLLLVLWILIKNSFCGATKVEGSQKSQNIEHSLNFDDIFGISICVLYFLVYFSNSFVVLEDSVTMFFSQTMIWMFGLKNIKYNMSIYLSQKSHKEIAARRSKSKLTINILSLVSHPVTLTLVFTLTCSVCLRLSVPFRACREEQWFCNNTIFMKPLANLAVDAVGYRNVRYFFSVAALSAFIISIRQWLKCYGNLNGYSPTVMCMRFAYPFAGVCCCLHWALQGLPVQVLDYLPWWQQVLLAQLVYVSLLLSILILVFKPLCVYKLPSARDPSIAIPYGGLDGPQIIPTVYKHLRDRLRAEADTDAKPPVVYGLGTVYSASLLQVVMVTGLLLSLLLGDGLAPSLLLALLTVYVFYEIYGASVFHHIETTDRHHLVPLSAIVTLGLLMSTFFFATGHQTTVPAIRFESAFTGFHGDFTYNVIPALLIALNTFASQVFFIVISPLLLFWPHLEGVVSQLMRHASKKDRVWRGDFVAYDDRTSFRKNIMRLVFGLLLFSAFKVLGAMAAAGLHRRHLMVWKIFAPRFVFEGAAMFVTFTAILLVYLFLVIVDRAVHKFAEGLNKEN
ncbi:GPI ethanolamine phosphate transferase 3-like [Haliotis cracherodii]|uniref:GPI ethanolamine phosphate transferase 3-like n=1 Tax=Haliotis cracherodii TaxID=6455 RepID=UPI0039EACFDA